MPKFFLKALESNGERVLIKEVDYPIVPRESERIMYLDGHEVGVYDVRHMMCGGWELRTDVLLYLAPHEFDLLEKAKEEDGWKKDGLF